MIPLLSAPCEIDCVKNSPGRLMLNNPDTHVGAVLGENRAFMDIVRIVRILGGVGHPPVKHRLRCTSPVKNLRAAAVIVAPVFPMAESE